MPSHRAEPARASRYQGRHRAPSAPSQFVARSTAGATAIALPIVGVIVIWLGWWGASGTKYVYQEIPYVVSGGIFGLALVFIGAALFARYSVARLLRFWLARVVADSQLQTDRLVEAIEHLAQATINGRLDRDPDAQRSRVGND